VENISSHAHRTGSWYLKISDEHPCKEEFSNVAEEKKYLEKTYVKVLVTAIRESSMLYLL